MTTLRRLAFLFALLHLPTMALAQTGRDSIRSVANNSFVPINVLTMQYGTIGVGGTFCRNSPCDYSSAVDLPSGATIVGIDLVACDAVAPANVRVEFFMCSLDPYTCSLVAAVTSADGGCGITSSAQVNVPVPSVSVVFPIYATISDALANVVLRAVRIRYQRPSGLAAGSARFPSDVPPNHPLFRFVEALAAAGVTAGCGEGAFCPDQPVTRGQLAVFLVTSLGLNLPN